MSNNDHQNNRRPRNDRNDRRNQNGRGDHRNDQQGPPVDRHPVLVPPKPKPEWKARTVKEQRDADMFHRTPKFMIPSPKELEDRQREKTLFDSDLFRCIEEGCSFDRLRNPRSLRGMEAKQLREEKLEAERQITAQAAAVEKEVARKAKRAASQKASRQRKAAAKKALVGEFVQLIKDATAALGPPRSLEEILDRAE